MFVQLILLVFLLLDYEAAAQRTGRHTQHSLGTSFAITNCIYL